MWLSRLLLLLVAVELVTMPLTQYLWTWDGFLHGGQDFELGLFMIVVCLCLVLLRAQHGRQGISLLPAIRRRLLRASHRRQWSRMMRIGRFSGLYNHPTIHRSHVVVTPPLLI